MRRYLFGLLCFIGYYACFGWGEGVQLPYPEITELSWSPNGEKIAFAANLYAEEEPRDIYVVDVNKKQITNLTNTPTVDESHPVWSPDGTLIAYQREDVDGEPRIWLMNSDGSNQRQLTQRRCHDPVWSPDGCYLVVAGFFSGDTGEDDELLLITKEGEEVQMLIASPEPECPAGWSPNNTFIVFTKPYRDSYGELIYSDLWRYNLNTKELTKLATGPFLGAVSFSPDGSKIVYDNDGTLWVMNIEGSEKACIFDQFQTQHRAAHAPVWSPNGQKVAFVLNTYEQINDGSSEETYWNPGVENIYLINPDGTGLEQITFFTGFLAKGQNPTVFAKRKGSLPSKIAQAKSSVEPKKGEGTKIARNSPISLQKLPAREDTSKPSQAPLLAGGLSLTALGYAIWKFLKFLG